MMAGMTSAGSLDLKKSSIGATLSSAVTPEHVECIHMIYVQSPGWTAGNKLRIDLQFQEMQKQEGSRLTINFSPGPTERPVSFIFCCVLLALPDLYSQTHFHQDCNPETETFR